MAHGKWGFRPKKYGHENHLRSVGYRGGPRQEGEKCRALANGFVKRKGRELGKEPWTEESKIMAERGVA